MDDFISQYPEFKEKLNIFTKINETNYSKIEEKINRYLNPISIKDILKLNKFFLHSKKDERLLLKKSYIFIANNESNRIESLIYRAISENTILIEDIENLIMFYTCLYDYYKYFIVINNDLKLPNIYLKKKFTNVDISNEFLEMIKNYKLKEKIFYYLIFGNFFRKKIILNFFEELDKYFLNDLYQKFQYQILKYLPEKNYYQKLASLFLYSELSKTIKILNFVDIDTNKILNAILDECFSNKILIRKVFLHFINLLNLFGIEIEIKFLILHSWLRFFLYEKFLVDFFDLLKKLKQKETNSLEFKVFLGFENLFLNNGTIKEIKHLCKKAGETNEFAKHKFNDIIKIYK